MATFGTITLGTSSFKAFIPTSTSDDVYDKLTIYATGQTSIIGGLWGRNKVITEDTIAGYNPITYIPMWGVTTYILGLFNGSTAAGNVEGISNPITNWDLFRLDPDSTQLVHLAELDVDTVEFIDFKALLDNNVRYYLFAKNDTEISSPIISDFITVDYSGHYLIDEENEVSYRLDIETTGASSTYEGNVTEYETNNQYVTVSRGNKNILRKTVKGIIRDEDLTDSDIVQENSLLEAFRSFVYSDRPKLYKDKRGRIYRVQTKDYKEPVFHEKIEEQLVYSEFTIVEVGDVYE